MSVLSKVLSLFKYDPVADKAKTFNIKQALNDNWDEIERGVSELDMAIEAETTRATGQANTVQGNLQKHIVDAVVHMTQAERDGLAAKLAEMSAAISANSSSLANKVNRSGDTMSGNLVIKSSNPYTDSAWQTAGIGLLDVNGIRTGWLGVGGDSTGICDFWLANDKGDVSLRPSSGVARINGNPIATATKPQVYDLPLAAGINKQNGCVYWKNQFGEVTVAFAVTFTKVAQDAILLATLPAGYRPSQSFEQPATFSVSGGRSAGTVSVDPDGSVRFLYYESGYSFGCATVRFVAA